MLKVDWIDTEQNFQELAKDWDGLAQVTDANNVFLRHAWFTSAWRWRSSGCRLHVASILRGERIIGLLPLIVDQADPEIWPARRALVSLDVPDTQRFSLLCAATDASEVSAALVGALLHPEHPFDVMRLRKLYGTDANLALMGALSKLPRTATASLDACPCVDLSTDWTTYYATRSRRLKKGNNLIANRLKKEFATIDVTRNVIDGSVDSGNLLDEVMQLCGTSWKRELPTSLHREPASSWIRELRRRMAGSEALVIWCLRLDGILVAAEIQLEHGGEVAGMRSEVREDFAQHGVGTYLNWRILESLLGSGRRLYNMGPGISEYKTRWSNVLLEPVTLTMFGSTARGRLGWARVRGTGILRSLLGRTARTESNA